MQPDKEYAKITSTHWPGTLILAFSEKLKINSPRLIGEN